MKGRQKEMKSLQDEVNILKHDLQKEEKTTADLNIKVLSMSQEVQKEKDAKVIYYS